MPGQPKNVGAQSNHVILATLLQLSVAVARPVVAGANDEVQDTVTSGGNVIVGGVTSITEIVCEHVDELPQASVALQTRVMTTFVQEPAAEKSS